MSFGSNSTLKCWGHSAAFVYLCLYSNHKIMQLIHPTQYMFVNNSSCSAVTSGTSLFSVFCSSHIMVNCISLPKHVGLQLWL